MKRVFPVFLIFLGLSSAILVADFPHADIKNKYIAARLYLPDANQGYYQGTRFDWSGVIASLEYQGHQYFGQWFEKYNPKVHDAISGPVEEFTTLGYEEAKPGETFLKIGVGALRKPDTSPYSFSKTYEIINPGKWVVHKKPDRVEFAQELNDAAGYSYLYRKAVRLIKGKPQLVLEHSLKNTGDKTINTSVYNHNFFTIDHQPTGPAIEIKFPFNVQATGKGFGDIAQVSSNKITYLRELNKNESVFSSGLSGFSNNKKDYDFRIENNQTGAGVRITSDQSLVKIVYWASSTTSCPEPYIQLQAEPGQEIQWKIYYEFYTMPK
jgi:hypothetical protein